MRAVALQQKLRKQVAKEASAHVEGVRKFLVANVAARGLTNSELASITGLSMTTVKMALRKGSRPTAHTMALIGAVIGLEVKASDARIEARPISSSSL